MVWGMTLRKLGKIDGPQAYILKRPMLGARVLLKESFFRFLYRMEPQIHYGLSLRGFSPTIMMGIFIRPKPIVGVVLDWTGRDLEQFQSFGRKYRFPFSSAWQSPS